jgi:hypothetical protein
VEDDDYTATTVYNPEEHERIKQILQFRDFPPSNGISFPHTYAFSKLVPGVSSAIHGYIKAYYCFGKVFVELAPVGTDLDDVAAKVIDNLLIRYINQPLVSAMETSKDLGQVLQIFINFEYLERIAQEVEFQLAKCRCAIKVITHQHYIYLTEI